MIGQYVETRSTIHHLDARAKLLLVLITVVGAFLLHTWPGLAVLLLLNVSLLLLTRVSYCLFRKDLWLLGWMLVLTVVFQLVGFAIAGAVTRAALPGILSETLVLMLRVTIMVCCAAWFYYATNVLDLSRAVERVFRLLLRSASLSRDAATTMAIALRFVPTVLEEAGELRLAQKFRGAGFDGSLRARIGGWNSVVIPLFLNTIERADKLALALETRGYGSCDSPSSYRLSRWRARDTGFAVGVALVVAALMVVERAW